MVSIPDWSRLGRLGESSHEPQPGQKYYRQQADEIVKQAKEHGYFASASHSFIEERCLPDGNNQKSISSLNKYCSKKEGLSGLRMVRLMRAHLRTVGDIGLCYNLRICILSNNYITRFEGLVTCTQLIKLDLHSNHITTLPPPAFWESMQQLKVLNLHDNPIGKIDNLHYLACCVQLAALTVHDTPLSLMRNYRHHAVNSIWSLKALDNFVISDEEIIEDAQFGGKFAALHPAFGVDLCSSLPELEVGYDAEFAKVYQVLQEINQIQAHHSPVVLIQRYIRGFLVRRKHNLMQEERVCNHGDNEDDGAVVTIQRRYRQHKGLETPSSREIPPPPSSPATDKRMPSGADAMKLDYDTYLNLRRPGSAASSDAFFSVRQPVENCKTQQTTGDVPSAPANMARSDGGIPQKRKSIFINLAKLQTGPLYSQRDESRAISRMIGPSDPVMATKQNSSRQQAPHQQMLARKEFEKKRRTIKSTKEFFGPVVENTPSPEPDRPQGLGDADEIPKISFRLQGIQHHIQYYDPIGRMITSRINAGKEVRAAEEYFHKQRQVETDKPERVVQRRNSGYQKSLVRSPGAMSFSCLHAIQQAYKNRVQAEKHVAKLDHVLGIKEDRESAKDRVREFHERRRAASLEEREKDQKRLVEMMEKREALQLKYLDKTRDKRTKSSHNTKQQHGELTFIGEFKTHNTSVSNALLRHDRHAHNEDLLQERSEKVKALKEMSAAQKELVRKYMLHRQLLRQTEMAMSRTALDTRMLQEASSQLLEARARVAQQKARSVQADKYPLPHVSAHPIMLREGDRSDTTPAAMALEGMDRWNTSIMMSKGRVGQHPTSVV